MAYFDESTEIIPREGIQAIQVNKFQSLLTKIVGFNRFYTAKLQSAGLSSPDDFQSISDLSHLPFTTKSELVQAQADDPPLGTNATYPNAAYIRFHQTSGTTGTPLRVLDTEESWSWWGKCWAYVLSGCGITAEDRVYMAFSFGPFIGFWSAVEGLRRIGTMMIPGGGADSAQRLHQMRDTGATVLCATPTYTLRLAEVAREIGFDLDSIPVRLTIHAGEPGANIPTTKSRIESVWSARCYDHAGASEVGPFSFECEPQPGGDHIIESEFIAEVFKPGSDEPVSPGEEGELILTNLGRAGFPVIRYRTGDLVRLNYDRCVCGRTFARLDGGVLGRADDMVIVRGVNVFPSAIENLVREYPEVDEYRVTVYLQHQMEELEIELETVEGVDGKHIQKAVQRTIRNALGLRPVVKMVERGTLPRYELKARRFRVSDEKDGH